MTRAELARRLARRAARDPLLRQARAAATERGARLWLVGGAVRDAALGRPGGDLDLVAAGRVPTLVRQLAATWGTRGFRFRKRGVTTWRFQVRGRAVDLVDATQRGIAADLARRELTINAVAFDLLTGRVEDPCGGLPDLACGKLRLPRPGVLVEDPVRALRLARFQAQFPRLRASSPARAEARGLGRALRRAPVERLGAEIDKLLAAPAPTRGLRALDDLGLTDAVLPELRPLRGVPAGGDRPDVWQHTLSTLEVSERAAGRRLPGATSLGRRPREVAVLRWALLLHDISKPETFARRPDGRPSFHGHEVLGARRAERVLRRLRVARAERQRVVRLILLHLRPSQLAEGGATPRGLGRLVRDAGDDLPLLVLHAACDALGSGAPDARRRWLRLRAVLERLLELDRARSSAPEQRLLDGRDVMRVLGLAPGPAVGRVLERVAELQAAGLLASRDAALAWLDAGGAGVPDEDRAAQAPSLSHSRNSRNRTGDT